MTKEVIYPPCRKCGKTHGMGIENIQTGEITPLELCYDCLWEGFPYHLANFMRDPREEQVADILKTTEEGILKNG